MGASSLRIILVLKDFLEHFEPGLSIDCWLNKVQALDEESVVSDNNVRTAHSTSYHAELVQSLSSLFPCLELCSTFETFDHCRAGHRTDDDHCLVVYSQLVSVTDSITCDCTIFSELILMKKASYQFLQYVYALKSTSCHTQSSQTVWLVGTSKCIINTIFGLA